MVANFPTLILEIAFASDPGAETPVWTDVSAYLRKVSITRGRQRELDRYQAGHATFVLDNRGRRFDPEYGANLFASTGTAPDATFEGSIGSWVAQANATVAHTTAQAKSGTGALQVTATTAGIDASAHSPRVPVSSGDVLAGTISGRAVATSRDVDLRFLWYDGDGVQITDQVFATFTDVTGSWTTGTVTATAPPGASEAELSLEIINPAASEVHRFDEAGILRNGITTWATPVFYAGRVVPMKRLRLRATYNAVTYAIFDGFVDSWDQQYEPPREAVCVVDATDAFKVFAGSDLPSSAYAVEVGADEPFTWWRLGEPNGATLAYDSSGNGRHAEVVGAPTFGADGLVSRETDTAMQNTLYGGYQGLRGPSPGVAAGTGAFTVEMLVKLTTIGLDNRILYSESEAGQTSGVTISLQTGTGKWFFQRSNTAGGGGNVVSTTLPVADVAYHMVFRFDGTNLTIWQDGVDVTGAPGTSSGTVVAMPPRVGYSTNGFSADAVIDEVAIYSSSLSSTRIAAHVAQVATPWNNDTPAGRLTRLLDYQGWPVALRDLDAGTSTILQSATLASSVLEHMQKVAESEFGELYMTADGKVRFEGRDALVNQPSAGTFGDGTGELAYSDIDFDYSDALLRNDVTVSRYEGVAQRAQDAASIKAYLRHSWTRDGLLYDNDALSRSAAEFFLGQYKDPLLRVSKMDVAPRRAPSTLFPQVLARELTDLLTVVRRPQGLGAAISQASVIEGITHTIDASQADWRTTWQLSPAYVGCYIEFDNGSGSAPCGFDAFAFAL